MQIGMIILTIIVRFVKSIDNSFIIIYGVEIFNLKVICMSLMVGFILIRIFHSVKHKIFLLARCLMHVLAELKFKYCYGELLRFFGCFLVPDRHFLEVMWILLREEPKLTVLLFVVLILLEWDSIDPVLQSRFVIVANKLYNY